RVEEIVQQEREAIQGRLREMEGEPPEAGDAALRDVFKRLAQKNLATLDALPGGLPETIQQLKDYEFLDPEAGRKFQELLQELQKSLLDSFFQNLTQQLRQLTPEALQEIQQMVRDLNRLLEQKRRGERPDFQSFMEQYGHMFGPEPPQSLEELIQRFQQQMSRTQSLLNSLSQEQREELLDLLGSPLFSPELQEELADLAANLDMLSSSGPQGDTYSFYGDEAVSLEEALRLVQRLQEMGELERQLERTRFGADVADVDSRLTQELLGDEAAQELEALKALARQLQEAGYVQQDGDELRLTPKGTRQIGQKALRDIFERMRKDVYGSHPVRSRGLGRDLAEETKQYEFGDPFFLDLKKTVLNALHRASPGVPVRLAAQDFEVHHTELLSRTSTVLMLDLSRSMPMRGNFIAAKKVALALNSLIRAQFPRDTLYLVGFSGYAREVENEELPRLNVGDFGRGTNMQAGLQVARRLLARHRASQRQVLLITDGEPTAYYEEDGRLYIEFPPGPRVLRETLKEVRRCTREGIIINTFMMEKSYHLRAFVTQLAKVNKGRVLFTGPEHLGQYILVDYVGNKGRRARL
ncbi:MAG: VWA domain-containing protein, partial [Chloroflexi bacterium]|nr:VWA domain-containing protein [Chloroflexota bacterium]